MTTDIISTDDVKAIRELARQDRSGEVDDSYARTGDAEDTIRRWYNAGRSGGDGDLVELIDRVGVREAARVYEAARAEGDGTPIDPTPADLDAIRAGAYNDLTRRIERRGIRLSHDEADALGQVGCDWLATRLKLRLVTDDRGTMFLPGTR